MAGAAYGVGYTYGYQFLAQFGVTPEQTGVNEIKLLIRAGIFGLFVTPIILGGLLVMYGVAMVLTDQSGPQVGSVADRNAKRTRHAWASLCVIAAFGVFCTVTEILLGHFEWGYIAAILLPPALALGATLWRLRRGIAAATIAVSIYLIGLLVLAAYFGGTHAGLDAATTGHVPPLVNVFGIDVEPVMARSSDASGGSALARGKTYLELGANGDTVYLYDCAKRVTMQLPTASVVLQYPLANNGSPSLRRCD